MTLENKETIAEYADRKGFSIEVYDSPEKDRQSHYWYGGVLVTLTHNQTGDKFELWANGDVRATLFDKDRYELVFVKDKQNQAMFYSEMFEYIKNDEELYSLINEEDEGKPYLEIDNNNWFELFSCYRDERMNFEEVLDASEYEEAFKEAIDVILEFMK